jgi:Zn finger protein HypA/HybF involved in hydrogenase expression
MSAIFEPESATWWATDRWAERGFLTLSANREDRSLTVRRRYPAVSGKPQLIESIELSFDQLADVEAALLNARLWLDRAIKQHAELKAAEEIEDADGFNCPSCGHRWTKHDQTSGCTKCLCRNTFIPTTELPY